MVYIEVERRGSILNVLCMVFCDGLIAFLRHYNIYPLFEPCVNFKNNYVKLCSKFASLMSSTITCIFIYTDTTVRTAATSEVEMEERQGPAF